MNAVTPPTVVVVAGVLEDSAGRLLISQRAAAGHQGGWWEFPGGKLDPGESSRAALERELREELGITVRDAELLMTYAHDYPDRRVELHVWYVGDYAGAPSAREGQPLRWAPLDQLLDLGLLPADRPIVEHLRARGHSA